MINSGHDLTFEVDESTEWGVNISMGPLSYRYRAANLKVHFGSRDERGSEHTIADRAFVAEVRLQMFASTLKIAFFGVFEF